MEKAHSNLGDTSFFIVEDAGYNSLTLTLKSTENTTISQTSETFVFNLNDVLDVFITPPIESKYKLIVNLKNEVLITSTNRQYKNLFHDEVFIEDLREESSLWFNFKNESDASQLEKTLLDLKKLLNSN